MKIALAAVVLSAIHTAQSVGNVPDGEYSSEEFAMVNPEFAKDYCDSTVSCAGFSYRQSDNDEEHPWSVYMYSFLPPFTNKTDDWITERSSKSFVMHPGKVVSNETLNLGVDPSTLSLEKAQELCKNHTDCLAFSYPTKSTEIDGLADIIFTSSIQRLEYDTQEEWQTHVVNEPSKADKANASVLKYDEDLEQKPYNTCCDIKNQAKKLPTIQDVQRVDTLRRIPCNISKEEFHDTFELTRTPVMLIGCSDDWPAQTEWTIEKLTKRFADEDSEWNTKMNGIGFEGLTWSEVTDVLESNKSVYIFDDLNDPIKSTMKDDYSTPPQFVDADMYPEGFAPTYGERNWFCLGERYSGAPPHADPVSTDAWNSLISGHKWWVIYPQNVEEDTVACDEECSEGYQNDVDWFASVGMHALRTSFGNASPMHVLQKAGETIYVPFPLIHSVLNMDTTVAITSNFGSRGNLQKVWETVLRKGSVEQWIEMHNEIMTDEQRQQVQEGEFWPPEKFAGIVIDDEGDSHYGGMNGNADELGELEIVYEDEDGNEFQYDPDEL